jgi:hypothetical protein
VTAPPRFSRGALVAVVVAIILAAQPGVAFADSEPGPVAGDFSPFGSNIAFYATLFGFAAVAVALGIFMLWRIARQTRADTPTDTWTGDEP